MKTTIDRGGRVVIPKALRERVGLTPGTEINIRLNEGTIELRPVGPKGRLVRKGGLLVWESPPGTPVWKQDEIERLRQEIREEREDHIIHSAMGLDDDEDWA